MVMGKRTTVGAAITSSLVVVAHFWPQHAAAFIALAVPLTFGIQMWIAQKYGVTTRG